MVRIILQEGTPEDREAVLELLRDCDYEVRDRWSGEYNLIAALVTPQERERPPAEED